MEFGISASGEEALQIFGTGYVLLQESSMVRFQAFPVEDIKTHLPMLLYKFQLEEEYSALH